MLPFEIDPPALQMLLKQRAAAASDGVAEADAHPRFVLLDVREPWEYATAHIANSLSMPMGDLPRRALQELDPSSHIVALCHAGVRSMNVAVWLRNQGFHHTQSLQGGIDAWSRLVDPGIPRY